MPSEAQTVGTGQGVADRPRPDYDPVGARVGNFTLLPSITTTIEATDNYLATDTNRQGDIYAIVQPEVYARSNWGRHRLDGRAYFARSLHANLPKEDTTQYGVSTSGAYDISRQTRVYGDALVAHYVESRSSLGAFQSAAKPVSFEAYRANIGVAQQFKDLTLNVNSAVDYRNFHDTRLAGGAAFDQDYRDVRVTTVGGSAQYSLRNGIGLIVGGSAVSEHYRVQPGSPGFVAGTSVDRDSSGFNLDGGITLELTRLVFGYLRVGYLKRNYQDSRLFDFSGLSYSGDILWNATPLTSVRFRASRSVEDTSAAFVAGNTRSDFHAWVDQELYRYVILTADAGYGHFKPNGPGIGGDEYTVGVAGRYLINRRFTVQGGLRYSGRTSDSSFLRYHAVTGNVGIRVAF